jgi:hypothetical protein
MKHKHEIIRDAIQSAGSQFVSVVFLKKDGERRQLTFNPLDFAEIKGTGSPAADPNIFRIRDIKLSQWRSFDARRVVSIKVSGITHTLSEELA